MVTQTSEYALRAVVYLAQRDTTDSASAQEIAEVARVSPGYLQKILRQLARAGILSAQRGTGGGFKLAKIPSAISVLDILQATDAPMGRIERCPLGIEGHTRLCPLHKLLDEEAARSQQIFAQTSIADLVDADTDRPPLCEPQRPVQATAHRRPIDGPASANDPGASQ